MRNDSRATLPVQGNRYPDEHIRLVGLGPERLHRWYAAVCEVDAVDSGNAQTPAVRRWLGERAISTLCGSSRSGLRRGGEREKAAVALRWRNVAGQRPRWQYWPMEIRDAVLDEAPAGCMVLSRSIAELWQAGHKNDPAGLLPLVPVAQPVDAVGVEFG